MLATLSTDKYIDKMFKRGTEEWKNLAGAEFREQACACLHYISTRLGTQQVFDCKASELLTL